MNLSFWEKDSLFKDIDFAIIGSGIVGLSAAITLKEKNPKAKVVILERGAFPSGASTRNAGFACFGSLTELIADLTRQTEEETFALIEKRYGGLQRLRERCGDVMIGYEEYGGIELIMPEETAIYKDCVEKMPWFNERLKAVTGLENTFEIADERMSQYGFEQVQHLIVNHAEGQIHTGKMMQRLLQIATAKGVLIFNGMSIEEIEDSPKGVRLHTAQNWEIEAQKVLVAVNGFAERFFPNLDIKPARNQVILTSPIENLPFKGCFHYDRGYYYFRNVGNRVLLGGGRNLSEQAEETTNFGETDLIQNALNKLLRETILPQQDYKIEHNWSGILGVGNAKIPLVQKVSDQIAVAVRLGGIGVAIGSLIGEEGASLLN